MHYVESPVSTEDVIKKSRFMGFIIPCQTENEAKYHLAEHQQQYINASHIVFAYRIKSENEIISRFYDAGEPKGTAGKPVFQQLEGKNLINLLCIVIRYYGGIKLGAGGLTRAYGNTAKKTIDACNIRPFIEHSLIKLELDYKQLQNFEYQLQKLGGVIAEQSFTEKVNLLIKIPKNNQRLLTEQFSDNT